MLRSALVVPVPSAAPIVDPWREKTCADRPSIGIPAHVTILFPFAAASEIDDMTISRLRTTFEPFESFRFLLRHTGRFPTTLYLAPEPPDTFVRLTEAIVGEYPEYPPFGGAFDTIVPHLTVAHGTLEVLSRVEVEVRRALPVESEAREVLLLVEVEPDWGRWTMRERFALRRD